MIDNNGLVRRQAALKSLLMAERLAGSWFHEASVQSGNGQHYLETIGLSGLVLASYKDDPTKFRVRYVTFEHVLGKVLLVEHPHQEKLVDDMKNWDFFRSGEAWLKARDIEPSQVYVQLRPIPFEDYEDVAFSRPMVYCELSHTFKRTRP
jgi:hypothetical protein